MTGKKGWFSGFTRRNGRKEKGCVVGKRIETCLLNARLLHKLDDEL